jgi:hypothetical protein
VYDGTDPVFRLSEKIVRENPMHRGFIEASLAALDADDRGEMRAYIDYCLTRGLSLRELAAAYNRVTTDTLVEQIYFRRHGRYRCASFADVAERVYFDAGYMKQYMHGLALTAFLWPRLLRPPRRGAGKFHPHDRHRHQPGQCRADRRPDAAPPHRHHHGHRHPGRRLPEVR